jgi:hypothetical protein
MQSLENIYHLIFFGPWFRKKDAGWSLKAQQSTVASLIRELRSGKGAKMKMDDKGESFHAFFRAWMDHGSPGKRIK